ncbi:MAG: hypothetical protein MPW17_22480 (plasmid) [Candidatus Manganitrophus sp.]|nr:hypothetical protein [Candidatus Manganitrophus sp.]WDT73403.1 MAG: hypothetical protein MPW17_22480 [Candidatus Manganitrophus sp.]
MTPQHTEESVQLKSAVMMAEAILSIFLFLASSLSSAAAQNLVCGQDLNGDGAITGSAESGQCMNTAEGPLCPVGAVGCTATYRQPICPPAAASMEIRIDARRRFSRYGGRGSLWSWWDNPDSGRSDYKSIRPMTVYTTSQ